MAGNAGPWLRHRGRGLLVATSLGAGFLLSLIAIRYLVVPEAAALSFGLPKRPTGHELYYIVGLRNLWLGLLALAFAMLRQWRALALWFALAAPVCFADAAIAAGANGLTWAVAFHGACGVVCAALALVLARVAAQSLRAS